MSLTLSTEAKNLGLDAKYDLLNDGYLRMYDGVRPAGPGTPLSGNTLLAELRFSATAFAAATGGTKTANAITKDSSANAGGTPTFFRTFKSDGTTAVADGSVGTSGADCNINAVPIVLGAEVTVTSMVLTAGG